ncbi:MAG: hypothetical protein NVSMB57_04770 [Actinomycetota bacterium]
MRLYRVVPWLETARVGEPGHPLTIPAGQGGGRVDNPEHYSVLYAAGDPAAACGESFGNKSRWTDAMFISRRIPNARRALVEIEVDANVVDLDDPRTLAKRHLHPSGVATPDRSVTQSWALRVFREAAFDGLRWWSVRDARWSVFGLWSLEATVVDASPLTLDHPAMVQAADMLGRSVPSRN